MTYELPCKHRGEPTGEEVKCGCGLGLQPAYFCHSPDVAKDRCLVRIGARASRGVKDTYAECSSCDWRFDDRPIPVARKKQRVKEVPIQQAVLPPRPGDVHRARQLQDIERRKQIKIEDMLKEAEFRKRLLTVPEETPQPEPFTGPITRNLIYHMGPFAGSGVWQRNMDQLLKRIGMFNGKRVMTIITGDGMDPPEKVHEYLDGHGFQFIEVTNNPTLREVVSFHPLMLSVQNTDPNEVTFFGHAKGVTRPVDESTTCHAWTDIMYVTCLDYWPLVEKALASFPIAGSFKKLGYGFQGSSSSWHYSGTFYWLRHSKVFNKEWRNIDRAWWGTESWPGIQFKPHEAACLFRAGTVPELDLYDYNYFHSSVVPDFLEWQRLHHADYRGWA